jgi:hypothetical protein
VGLLCTVCPLLALSGAAGSLLSRPREWLLGAHFRKCLVRRTFDAMQRQHRAEYDLQTSNDTSMCKVVCGAQVDRAHVIRRFVTITSSICKDCFELRTFLSSLSLASRLSEPRVSFVISKVSKICGRMFVYLEGCHPSLSKMIVQGGLFCTILCMSLGCYSSILRLP